MVRVMESGCRPRTDGTGAALDESDSLAEGARGQPDLAF
jgi:hypothetical protein